MYDGDLEVLFEYRHGKAVEKRDKTAIDRLCMVGMMHTGTSTEINHEDQRISFRETAKTTNLGKNVLFHVGSGYRFRALADDFYTMLGIKTE